jgi:hypothetical protein
VLTNPPGANFITVSAPGGNVTLPDLQAFAAGSLVYKPKAAPASVLPVTPFAEMVAKNVKDGITKNKKPLTASCDDGTPIQFPMVDTEDGRTAIENFQMDPDSLPRLVGLYAGGARFACGIFHPAGLCMMRNNHGVHAEFCAVCRYIIVDGIAPELHPAIDADYDRIYPLR